MLKQTEALKNIYETPLITGAITDAQLRELLVPSSSQESLFKLCKQSAEKSPKKTGFNLAKQLKDKIFSKKNPKNQGNDNEVNDNNFGVMDGMKDFVLHIAPMMTAAVLHDITARLIELSPDEVEKNTYMRNANLVKVFLAYELYAFPDNAKKNLASERMQKEFSGPNDISNLRRVILEPSIVFFEAALNTQRAVFVEEGIQSPAPIALEINRASDLASPEQDCHRNHEQRPSEPAPQLPVDLPQESSPVVLSTMNNSSHQRLPSEPAPVAPDLLASLAQMAAAKNNEYNDTNNVVEAQTEKPTAVGSPKTAQLAVELTQGSAPPPVVLNATNNSFHQRLPSEPVPVAPELANSSAQTEGDEGKHVVEPQTKEAATVESPLTAQPHTPAKRVTPFRRTPAIAHTNTVSSPVLTNQPPLELSPTTVTPVNSTVEPKPVALQNASSTLEQSPTPASIDALSSRSTTTNKPAMKPQQTRMSRMPEPAPVPSTKVANNEQDTRIATLIKLCQNYLSHLAQPATADVLANNKLNIVKKMLEHLENPRVRNARQKIRNMNMVLTPENKAILAEQRSGIGIKFLETLLHVLTVGLFSKYSKNTFAFWKSHGEALGDNIEQLTRDNNEAFKR